MAAERLEQLAEGDALYEQYGKPLEAEHWGEFVAIMKDGRTLLGPTMHDVVQRSVAEFGKGGFLFKVGERVVGHIR